jgi:formylmethanofuran dehydrogenase subunit E
MASSHSDRRNPDNPSDVVCPMCHRTVPADTVVPLGGREICRACASMWFDDDEAEDEK